MVRALGVQSRVIWHVIAGLLSDQRKPTRSMQTPKMPFFSFLPLVAAVFEVPHQSSKARQTWYSSRASRFSLRDSHEWCFCVQVRERACVRVSLQDPTAVGTKNTVSITNCSSSFLLRCLLLLCSRNQEPGAVSRAEVPFSFFCSFSFLLRCLLLL